MKTVRTWCIRILMILFTVIFLYPLFWNLMSAFKTNAEYLTDPYALPAALNLDNFVAAWQKANIAAYFGNSIFVTVLSTVLLLLLVIPISYVLARYRFAGSKLISTIYMACIFLQATYIMIPLFLELQADNDHCADQLLQAAREKTGAANARILLAENQTLYLGSGRRCGYGMIAFLGRPFSVTDAYFRMLL